MNAATQSVASEQSVTIDDQRDRKALIATVAIVCSYLPLLYLHGVQLWSNPEQQYFPFVLAAVAYFIWTRFRRAERIDTRPQRSSVTVCLIGAAWIILLFGLLTYTTWLAYVSALVFSAAVFFVISQQYRVSNLWGIWLLLALISPLPYYVHQGLVQKLQSLSSTLSSQVLDLVRINHLMEGNVLRLPDKDFFVDEACSGVVSVMAVVAAAGIYAVWRNRSVLHVCILLVSGVVGAIAMNVVRISTIAFVHAKWNLDWSEGMSHEILGFTTFSGTFLAMASVDCILAFVLDPITSKGDELERVGNPVVRIWNGIVSFMQPTDDGEESASHRSVYDLLAAAKPAFSVGIVVAVGFGLLAVVQSVTLATAVFHNPPDLAAVRAIDSGFLPDRVGEFRKEEFEAVERTAGSEYGDFSRSFTFVHESTGQRVLVSLDFPFNRGWHELSVCYLGTGWKMASREVRVSQLDGSDKDWNYVSATFEKPTGETGHLAFSSFDEEGNTVSPPATGIWEKVWRRLWNRNPNVISNRMLQLQVWTQSDRQMDDASIQNADQLMLDIRPVFLSYQRELSK